MLPKPGSGGTPARFAALADWATRDLSLARLVEGHVDALAILEEAGKKAGFRSRLRRLGRATISWRHDGVRAADGWHLEGTKPSARGAPGSTEPS